MSKWVNLEAWEGPALDYIVSSRFGVILLLRSDNLSESLRIPRTKLPLQKTSSVNRGASTVFPQVGLSFLSMPPQTGEIDRHSPPLLLQMRLSCNRRESDFAFFHASIEFSGHVFNPLTPAQPKACCTADLAAAVPTTARASARRNTDYHTVSW